MRATLNAAANVVYFARIGDQDRFGALAAGCREIMVYVREFVDFTSQFGRLPHARMVAERARVDGIMAAVSSIENRCPDGTHMQRCIACQRADVPLSGTSVRRFPLGAPAPIPADGCSGEVALCAALIPTGNSSYHPAVLTLNDKVMAVIDNGGIVDFEGSPPEVARIRAHYGHVAGMFGIDPYVMHSWHAGIHPAVVPREMV